MGGEMTTEEAVTKLATALKDDEGFYIAWQSNIAMAFVDEYRRTKEELAISYITHDELNRVANRAAHNFLANLINAK